MDSVHIAKSLEKCSATYHCKAEQGTLTVALNLVERVPVGLTWHRLVYTPLESYWEEMQEFIVPLRFVIWASIDERAEVGLMGLPSGSTVGVA